jgi:hypothetical protein
MSGGSVYSYYDILITVCSGFYYMCQGQTDTTSYVCFMYFVQTAHTHTFIYKNETALD